MIQTIVTVCGRDPAEIRFGEMPEHSDEPKHWVADIEQTTKLTGWRPIVGLRRGIEQTLAWAESHACGERHDRGRMNRPATVAV